MGLLSLKKCSANLRLTMATLEFLLDVAAVEIAAFQKRNSHGFEISRRERVHVSLHVFAILRLMAFDRHVAVRRASREKLNSTA